MKKLLLTFLTLSMLIVAPVSFAQTRPPLVPGSENNLILPHPAVSGQPSEAYFGGVVLPTATKTVIALAGACAFLFIIIGGVQILTAYGSDEKIATGKKTITYAVVGFIIALLSYAIVSVISAVRVGNSVAGGTGSGPGGSSSTTTSSSSTSGSGSSSASETPPAGDGPYGPGNSYKSGPDGLEKT